MAEPESGKLAPERGRAGRNQGTWERDLVEKLAFAAITEQRRARRWGMLFKFLLLLYLVAILVIYLPDELGGRGISTKEHTAVIELRGLVAADAKASAENVIKGLRAAFKDKKSKGIILRINSPGGSPVQAAYINAEIERLRKKYPKKPVYAVVVDLCASGGYYVAVAAEKIYASEASIVGSIGVRMDGFGFVDTLNALGIERRLLVAGDRKAMMDPFSPAEERDIRYLRGVLEQIHQQFIAAVKRGRGERLKDDPNLFSGLFWTGQAAVELGLIDGFGSAQDVAREIIGAEELVDYTHETDLLERLAERIGAGAVAAIEGFTALGDLQLR
jgi:protease-4